MTKQTIDNLQPGTLDGDSLYDTAQKINENFNEIYAHFGDGQALDNGYVGLKNLNAGLIVSQGLNTYTTREITSTGASIQITNGTGATGDPTLDLSETGVIASGSAPTVFAEVGLTVDVHGRITAIATPTLLTEAQAQASNAASSATAAATSATASATSATASAASATSAANDVATIGTSLSQAATHATNAGNSATAAATSETNAATSATTATTQAGLATTNGQAQVALATTQAGNASTSATNASNSASAAATSETNAGNSATASATSATNASNSATSAASSATSAAASFDSFDDIYLGEKSSAPTQDNDGDALSTGSLYFDTTANELKVYNGSSWQGGVTATGGFMTGTNNLSDLNNAATSRTNLGLGTIATQASNSVAITGGSISGITDLALADGGTGASTASAARTNLGLHAVANTGAYGDLTGKPTHLQISGGSAGVIPYQTGSNTTAFSAVGTSGQMLVSGGTGAPTWVDSNTLSSGGGIATQMKFA